MTNGKVNGNSNGFQTKILLDWPSPINEDGMYGIAGEYVRLVEPHTEGDPNIILLSFLTCAGNLLGRNFYVQTGADRHYGNLFLCPVGTTATGRKGSGVSAAKAFFTEGHYAPGIPHFLPGLSTGEGLMHQVRDPSTKREADSKGIVQEIIIDPGVPDKRLLISVGEFQQVIAQMRRENTILSSILRQAWDTGTLANPSKTTEVKVHGAHVSIIACISKEELTGESNDMDAQNGFLNRFLFACSQRSRLLPEGGDFDNLIESPQWTELQQRFNRNIAQLDNDANCIIRDSDTQDGWGRNALPDRGLYNQLSQGRPGIWGCITARGAQQVIRLSLIISRINGHPRIQEEDQAAAYEIWRYCDHSARYVFGDCQSDPLTLRIITALREAGTSGLSRSDVHALTHRPIAEIENSLVWLSEAGLAQSMTVQTGGRPLQKWFATE